MPDVEKDGARVQRQCAGNKESGGKLSTRFANALSLVSHVAAIIGTIAAVIDLLHHW